MSSLVMDGLAVAHAAALRGTPALPGDKSIGHRALLLALLAQGTSRITGLSDGDDVVTTRRLIERLGAGVVDAIGSGATTSVLIESPGLDGLGRPPATLDCRNAGTALRLVAGILAGQPFETVLDGDASLRRRPVGRVVEPLRAMGAALTPSPDGTPPLRVRGRRDLAAIDWTPAVASAQVKSAILLAGLRARGTTRVHESVPTRDHTERMLRACGVDVRTMTDGADGTVVEVAGGQRPRPLDLAVPTDASAAAFWLVAGAAHPDADLALRDVGANPGRRGALDILLAMGARIDEARASDPNEAGVTAPPADVGEPRADLRVRSSELRGIDVDPRQAVAAIDEIPILCLAATQAHGVTTFRGVGELRVKESDRIAGIVTGLSALGANVAADGDDVRVVGPTPLHGASVDGSGDHRLVMTFAIAGLLAAGRTTISGAASAAISDPGFIAELERIRQ
jgi:3-phosphoshikimate 1-carboxyvinyltransferase